MTGGPAGVLLHAGVPTVAVPHWAALFVAVFGCWTAVAVGVWGADALFDRLEW